MQAIRINKAGDKAGLSAAGAKNPALQQKKDSALVRSNSRAVTPGLSIQASLTIGEQGDKYEKEADHVAEQVVGPVAQRTPSLSTTAPPAKDLKRPPNITPILHQPVEEQRKDEAQPKEEEEVASSMEQFAVRRFAKDHASPDPRESRTSRPHFHGGNDVPMMMGNIGRGGAALQNRHPAPRGPPVVMRRVLLHHARPPPGHVLQMSRSLKTVQHNSPLRRIEAEAGGHLIQGFPRKKGELRSHSIFCRGPPQQARTKESEGRLERDLRQSRGGGEPLPEKARIQMEAGIGADFSGVRVHTDDRAQQMNRTLGSQAFASGNDIFFNQGNFNPESKSGRFLLAHELTHTVQQGASPKVQRSPDPNKRDTAIKNVSDQGVPGVQEFRGTRLLPIQETGSPCVLSSSQKVPATSPKQSENLNPQNDTPLFNNQGPRAPPIRETAAPGVQGGWIGDKLNSYARHIPGWELFTVIIGYNPLTERDVDRTPRNFLRGFMGLVPGGTVLYDKLDEGGVIDDAFNWLSDQINDLNLSWTRLKNALDDAWDDMDFIRWDPFDYNLKVLKRHLTPIWEDVKEFGSRVIDKMVELARELILVPLAEFVKERTRAYPLLSVILGADPITGETVERNLYNIVSAFLLLTESGEEYLNKLNESGKLLELSEWLDAEIERLNVGPEVVTDAFKRAFELLDLNAVIHPVDTITKLWNIFAGPVTRLFNFVVNVVMKVLGLIKDWLLGLLKEYAAKIPGYPLLTVLLEKDPLTGEKVPRNPENFIKGFMSFVPGGLEKFKNLQKSGAISKAFKWLGKAITKLGLIGQALIGAFTKMWETFSINDLTNPVAAFERVVAIFTDPVKKIIDFAVEVGLKVLEFIFEGVLGPTGARVLAILKKAKSTFMTIIKDPIKFVKNLIDAVMKGFNQFKTNILKHLKAGLIGWLVGTLGKAGVKLPEKWDLKGIVSFVLGILGLTYDRIRPKLVKVLGEKTVGILETTFDVVMLLFTEGPGAVWKKFLEYIDNLKETVMGGIRDWVISKVVTSAVIKIASMLNPAGAVIQAIIATYNTVMFFIERINQILDLVESVVNSIAKIAAGKIDDAANFVEQAMARTIPVIISFLARLLGLGNIAGTIQEIIKKLQAAVDKALDKVIAWLVKQAKRLIKAGKGAIAKVFSWWKARKGFKDKGGAEHEIFFKGKGAQASLMVASSDPKTFTEYIKLITPSTPEEKTAHAKAKKIAKKIDGMKQKTSTGKSAKGEDVKDATPEFQKEVDNLAIEVAKIKMKGKIPPSSPIKFSGLTAENYGKGVEVDKLTKIHPPGSEPTADSDAWKKLLLRKPKSGGGSLYVRGHLLNHNIGGPGNDWRNLTPITQDANNRGGGSMLKAFETPVKNSVDAGNAVHFKVTPGYTRQTPGVLSKLDPVPAGKTAAERDMIRKIATEEAKIPINVVCHAEEYDPLSDDKKSVPPDPKLPSKVLNVPVPNTIATDNVDDYALEASPTPPAGRIDDPVAMENAQVPSALAGQIAEAVKEINRREGKVVNAIAALKAPLPSQFAQIQILHDDNKIKAQTKNPFTQDKIEDYQRKVGVLAPQNVSHAYYKLDQSPTSKIFSFTEIGAHIATDPKIPGLMWNNKVALYVQGISGRADQPYFRKLFRKLGYKRAQYPDDVQTKSEVSPSVDQYEREADNVADHVVGEGVQRSPLPRITSLPRANRIHRSRESGASVETPQLSGDFGRSKGAGAPLPAGTRKEMEHGIGGDFSGVRIHDDSNAANSPAPSMPRPLPMDRISTLARENTSPGQNRANTSLPTN